MTVDPHYKNPPWDRERAYRIGDFPPVTTIPPQPSTKDRFDIPVSTEPEARPLYEEYISILQSAKTHGLDTAPRSMRTLELPTLYFEAKDSEIFKRPKLNIDLGIIEGLSIVAGFTDWDGLKRVAPKTFKEYFKHNQSVNYAERLQGQQYNILDRLINSADFASRQAIAYIGDNGDSESFPCTQSVQAIIRDDTLRLHINMRSWDLYRGLPYDLIMWTVVSNAFLMYVQQFDEITKSVVSFFCPAAHLYYKDMAAVNKDIQGVRFQALNLSIQESFYSINDMRGWAQETLRDGRFELFFNGDVNDY